jgi:SAM-dependent methyltransferase
VSRRQQWNDRYASKELVWSAGPNRLFEAAATNLTPGSALDVACGEGRNAIWLAEQGWAVSAVDFSDVGIEKARQLASRRGVTVDWIVGDVADDAFPEAPDPEFDLVLVLYLHTSPDERNRWLPKISSLVASAGTFIYIGHDPSNIELGVGGPQQIELLPDADEVCAALDGFRFDVAGIVERPVDADPGHGRDLAGIARDTMVQAVKLSTS